VPQSCANQLRAKTGPGEMIFVVIDSHGVPGGRVQPTVTDIARPLRRVRYSSVGTARSSTPPPPPPPSAHPWARKALRNQLTDLDAVIADGVIRRSGVALSPSRVPEASQFSSGSSIRLRPASGPGRHGLGRAAYLVARKGSRVLQWSRSHRGDRAPLAPSKPCPMASPPCPSPTPAGASFSWPSGASRPPLRS